MSSRTREALREGLEQARRATARLLAGLTDAEARRQAHPLFSPLAWHAGHVAWQEEFWALRRAGGQAPIDRHADAIYDSFSSHKPSRSRRLPALDRIRDYARAVRERTLRLLESADLVGGDPLLRGGWVFRFLANHERQHGETMAVVRLLAGLPLADLPAPVAGDEPAPSFVEVPGGEFLLGCDADPDGWDNERRAHPVSLGPFRIARHAVTSGEWLRFMEAGGYEDDALWPEEGRAWRRGERVTAPLFWARAPELPTGWKRFTLAGWRPVEPSHPVSHLSWHEAQAFARFAGARLPTEAEWERAASWDDGCKRRWPWGDEAVVSPGVDGANLDLRAGDTTPCAGGGPGPGGVVGLAGNVWEWTSSCFRPYIGFEAGPYRGYSAPWFGEQHRVLRGGSHLTHPAMARTAFRNWFVPGMRAFPTGLRLARDP